MKRTSSANKRTRKTKPKLFVPPKYDGIADYVLKFDQNNHLKQTPFTVPEFNYK